MHISIVIHCRTPMTLLELSVADMLSPFGALRQVVLLTKGKPLPEAKRSLFYALDDIETKIIELHDALCAAAMHHSEVTVRSLIAAIQEDRKFIESLCIHRCDRQDPQISIDHDRTNNDHTLTLHEQLAAAADLGVDPRRVIFLHRMQRLICRKLKKLGIDVSQN